MSNKLYVGNLSFQLSEEELESAFGAHGAVSSVKIITDRDTGRSKGFGFIEMGSSGEAQTCIENLDGKDLGGRNLRVSVAQDRKDAPRSNNRW
jgi:RNA recognition motif-containing protein